MIKTIVVIAIATASMPAVTPTVVEVRVSAISDSGPSTDVVGTTAVVLSAGIMVLLVGIAVVASTGITVVVGIIRSQW